MSLNDQTFEDLTPIVDNDVIKKPSPIKPSGDSITIIPETDQIKAQSIIPEHEMQKLPQMDVSFKIITDAQTKLIDLRDVEAEIISQEAISRSGAEYVQLAFEDFLKGPVYLSEFTQTLSQTNYDYTLKFMHQKIAKEEACVVANFQTLIDQPTEDCKILLTHLHSSYIPALQSQLYSLRSKSLDLLETISTSKDLIVPYADGFADLGKIDLKTLDVDLIKNINFDQNAVKAAVLSIQLQMKCPFTNALVHTVNEGKDYDNILDPVTRMSYQGACVTIFDLLKFFSSDIDSVLERSSSKAKEALEKMCEIQECSLKHKGTPEMNQKFINENTLELQKCFSVLHRTGHTVNDLSYLAFSTMNLMDFYKKL